MNKRLPLLVLLVLSQFVLGQNRNVELRLDLNGTAPSANGIHVAGNFQQAAGFTNNWDPSSTALSSQGNGVYSVNLSIPDGNYEFKFINGNAWGSDESIPGACAVNGNRGLNLSSDTLIEICFALCACPPDSFQVSFQIDMNAESAFNISTDSLDIAGGFNAWNSAFDPSFRLNDPDGDGVFTASFLMEEGTVDYKVRYHNSSGVNWESGTNKQFTFDRDTTLAIRCFNSDTNGMCPSPPDTFNISFQIDLSADTAFNANTDQVDVAGPFNAWSGVYDANYALTDPDGDLVYTATYPFPEQSLEFKARWHNAGVTNWEPQANNQIINFSGDSVLAVRCFGSDTAGACPTLIDSFFVTLQVDLSNETAFNPVTDSIDIAGAFSNWDPAYNSAYALSDANNDSIWQITLYLPDSTLEYKARYHNASGTNWEGGLNKLVTFFSDTTIGVRCFGSDTLGLCPNIPDTFNISFQIDLSNEVAFDPSTDQVDIAGPFNAWSGVYDANYALTDPDGDLVYTATYPFPEPSLEFKARWHNSGVTNWEPQANNQIINFSGDSVLAVRCFGSDTAGACPTLIDTFNISFQIDLSNEVAFDPSTDQVDVAGPFNAWSGSYDANYALTDPDGDLVYTATYPFPEPSLEFKARWHNAGVTNWEPQANNQIINFSGDSVLAVRCFGSDTAGACPALIDSFFVTLQVDLSNETAFNPATDSIDIAGAFSNWDPAYNSAYALTDANNDSIWQITLYLPDSTLEYKARYHNASGTNWEGGLNKLVTFFSDTTIGVRCFGSDTLGLCPNIPDTFNISFQIDLSNETAFDPSTDQVDVAGPFNAWSGVYDANYALTDPDGDLVYTATYPFPEPSLEFKARWHNAGVTNWEPQANNQIINFSGDSVLAVRCFGSDTAGACPTLIDSFFVTLQVDLSNETAFNPLLDSIDIAGAFSNWDPAYNSAYALSDANNDSIWQITLYLPDSTLEYKARYHNASGTNWEGGLNKLVTFFSDTTIGVRCFGGDTLGLCPNIPDTFNISFQIDLSNEVAFDPSTDQVDVAGPFNAWSGVYDANYALTDPDGDLVYTATYPFPEPLVEFKARWHNSGVTNWEPQANNQIINFSGDSVLAVRCFGSDTAGACPTLIDSFFVTLQVDLSNETAFNPATDSIDIAGAFSNWDPAYNSAYALSDANNDSIWQITLYLPDSTLEYKARYHNASGTNWEGGLNKLVTFFSDTTIGVRCFGSDTLGLCPNIPDTFNISFQIDLSNEVAFDPSTDQVDVAGPFNAWSGVYDANYALTDPDGDLVYTATYPFPEPSLEFKARWHNSGVTNWEPQANNQIINFSGDSVLAVRCFGSDTAGACPALIDSFFVTLQVDLSNETAFNPATDSIDIAGAFSNWDPAYNSAYALSDANNDSIWQITLYLPDSTLEYKARYHNASGTNWEAGLNKLVTFFSDTTIGVRCFGSDTLGLCPNIPDTFNISFQIDLSNEVAFDPSTDQVDVAGPFNAWSGVYDANYALTDPDGDLVYTATYPFPEPSLEFKARWHNSGVTNWEPQANNQIINFSGDSVLALRCFGSDTAGACPALIDSFFVTLQVDLSNETAFNPATDSIDIAGAFSNWDPAYNSAYALSDANNDSIWQITLYLPDSTLEYKARYHNASGTNWEAGLNKLVTFFSDTTIGVRCFGSDTLGLCPNIPDTFNISFQIDLSNEVAFDPSTDQVDVAGPFNAWSGVYDANYALTDPDGDLVYTATYPFPEPSLEFKARWHNAGVTNWEPQANNQIINFSGDSVLAVRCFGSDTAGACPTLIDTFNISFQIDLSNEVAFDPSTDQVDVAGPFNAWSGVYDANYALTDPDGDLVYTATYPFPEPSLEFKARWHNAGVTNWEPQTNNQIINFSGDSVLAVRCFGSDTAGACPTLIDSFFVTLQVDLSNETAFNPATDSIDIAGAFSNWDPAYNSAYALSDANNDSIWQITLYLPDSTLEYKARYHNASGTNWEGGLNKLVTFFSDTTIGVRCFGSDTLGLCPNIPDTFNISFQIDLSNEVAFDPSTDQVDVAGPFNAWSGVYDANYALTDPDGDLVYTATYPFPEPLLEFKARWHNAGVTNWEPQANNQIINFSGDSVLAVRCFGSDTAGACPALIDSFFVTLQVDLSNETAFNPATDSIDIAGAFSNWDPAYNSAYALSDANNDSIWQITLYLPDSTLEYKARYHNASGTNWEGGLNKLVTFFSDTTIGVRCFGSDTLGLCPNIPDTFNISFQIDLSNEVAFDPSTDQVDIAGPFNAWSGVYDANYALTDPDGDLVYTATYPFPEPSLEFKARWHNSGVTNWEPQANNQIINFSGDSVLAVRCFGSDTAGACPTLIDTFNISFQIDLSNEVAFDPSTDQVDVAGPFNAWSGSYDANYALTDPDGDLVYTATYPFPEPSLEFKARWHNAGVTNWEPQANNQIINFSGDSVLAVRCFGSDTAGACPALIDSFFVTLQVDLSNETAFNPATDSIDIAGAFSNWDPAYNSAYALTDANNDSIWQITLYLPDSTLEYKARYHNASGTNWEGGLNKLVTFFSDTTIGVRCFGSDTLGLCPNIPDTFNISFQIDLSNEVAFDPSTDQVDVAGPFNAWSGVYDANYALTDPDGDLVYTATYPFPEPFLEFKARWHNAGVTNWEPQANNNLVNFNKDSVLDVRCFGNPNYGPCTPIIDTFFVTLQVDMNFVAGFNPLTDSIDIAGPFNAWNANLNPSYLMSDIDGDLVYDFTIYAPEPSLEYKARWHNSGITNWEGGLNKLVLFSSDTVIAPRCFGSDTLGLCPTPPPSPGIRFISSNLSLGEASGITSIGLEINPSNQNADTILIAFNNGIGIQSGDYQTIPALLNDTLHLAIPASSDTLYFDLQIIDDLLVENTEQFDMTISASGSGNLQIGSPNNMLISIIDNDIPPIYTYSIGSINQTDLNGFADSLNVYCRIGGVINSIDYRAGQGYDFHIEDQTGAIHLSSPVDLNAYSNPSLGDSLFFIGNLLQSNGLLSMVPDSLNFRNSGNSISSPKIAQAPWENFESELVRLNGYRFLNPSIWPSSGNSALMLMTNGPDTLNVFIDSDTDIDGQNPISGSFDLIGVISQNDPSAPYTEDYLIRPRFYADFIPINTAALSISEIMPQSGLSWPLDGDWFEIYNHGNLSINLNGYSWDDEDGLAGTHTISTNMILAPGEKAIVLNIQNTFRNSWLVDWKQNGHGMKLLISGRDFNGFSGLGSQGDAVYLFDPQGHLTAFTAYPGSAVNSGFSLEFDTLGSFTNRAMNGFRGAYTSQSGDVGSPSDLSPIGLQEGLNSQILIYPNPVSDRLYIQTSTAEPKTFILRDNSGRIVRTWDLSGSEMVLEMSGLPAGMYLIEVQSDEMIEQFKIQIQP